MAHTRRRRRIRLVVVAFGRLHTEERAYKDKYGQGGYSYADLRSRRSYARAWRAEVPCEQCGCVVRWHNQYNDCVGYYPTDTLLERQERVSSHYVPSELETLFTLC